MIIHLIFNSKSLSSFMCHCFRIMYIALAVFKYPIVLTVFLGRSFVKFFCELLFHSYGNISQSYFVHPDFASVNEWISWYLDDSQTEDSELKKFETLIYCYYWCYYCLFFIMLTLLSTIIAYNTTLKSQLMSKWLLAQYWIGIIACNLSK